MFKSIFNPSGGSRLLWPGVALAAVLLFNLVFTNGFFRLEIKEGHLYGSLVDILNRGTPVMLLSLGMTLVIATGGVDLSVGAVMAIAGAIAALMIRSGWSLPFVLGASLSAAVLAGLWNGTLVGFLEIPPIVATLILMVSGRGVAQLLTAGQHVSFENKGFEFIGRGHLFGLPFTVTLTLAVFALLTWATRRTALGLFIEATGDNETASRYAGIQTRAVKILVYGVCALCAGLAGLIVTGDIKEADPSKAGTGLELDAILATVIGGTVLQGGRFYPGGSLLGAILLQALTTTILTRGVAVEFTLVVKALVIVGVCLLQSDAFRRSVTPRRSVA